MAGFAFLFAPLAFAHVGATPAFAATIAACVRELSFSGNLLGIAAVVITIFAGIESRRAAAAIVAAIVIAMIAGFAETSLIVPRMEATPLLSPAYEALHRTSSGVYSVALLGTLAAFVMSGLRYRLR